MPLSDTGMAAVWAGLASAFGTDLESSGLEVPGGEFVPVAAGLEGEVAVVDPEELEPGWLGFVCEGALLELWG